MNVFFFNQTVKDLVFSFDKSTHPKIHRQIYLLETLGHQLCMPYSKKIGHNLYELRIRSHQQIRILYCFYQDRIYIIHVFIKKTRKTPARKIRTALKRISLLT